MLWDFRIVHHREHRERGDGGGKEGFPDPESEDPFLSGLCALCALCGENS
jgi:hypothetical protein